MTFKLIGGYGWFIGARVEMQKGAVYVRVLVTRLDATTRVLIPYRVNGVGCAVRAIGIAQPPAPRL